MSRIIDPYSNAEAVRNPHGAIIVDGQHVCDTLQCCHCGGHFTMIRGSGRRRGFCTGCGAVTCGKAECDPCAPFEKWMDKVEKNAGG